MDAFSDGGSTPPASTICGEVNINHIVHLLRIMLLHVAASVMSHAATFFKAHHLYLLLQVLPAYHLSVYCSCIFFDR